MMFAGVFALALAAPAAAFDNADCKAFLTGTWTSEAEQDMDGTRSKITAQSSYSADGTFTQAMEMTREGQPPQAMSRSGTWDAAPGARPDACLARLTPRDEPESSIELTVIDADTVARPDGHQSHRVR